MAMKTRALILLAAAAFVGSVVSAAAGPCTAEIDRVAKAMSAHDAGSGPTPGAGASAGTPATSSSAASGQHPPTTALSAQTQGTAASPEDVRKQMQGQPTAAQQGNPGQGTQMAGLGTATDALQRARELDGQGKEAECMAAVRQAGQSVGQK
jgi:hypothetical protein